MRGYPQFSFSISITLVKIYISCIIINRDKNTFELVGTVLKCRILHVPNLMQMRKIYCFRSFTLDSAQVKCDV